MVQDAAREGSVSDTSKPPPHETPGSPRARPGAADLERIGELSDEELDAELRADGIDPDAAERIARQWIERTAREVGLGRPPAPGTDARRTLPARVGRLRGWRSALAVALLVLLVAAALVWRPGSRPAVQAVAPPPTSTAR